MNAFVFPGQSSQKKGMGRDLYNKCPKAKDIFECANDILGYRFSDFMFSASEEVLMDTRVTQPAIFIYQVAAALGQDSVIPDCTAGHSLGEYAALVVAGALSFEETLPFIVTRGQVFYDAFQKNPSAMAAVIALPDEIVIDVLNHVGDEDGTNLYIANYNGPGQLVITGASSSIKKACKILKEKGAKRALVLPQKGVGHSPNSADEGRILGEKLQKMHWMSPRIPVYQDADGLPHIQPSELLDNEVKLMTHPVLWTDITMNMKSDGVTNWFEVGCDDTLQKIVYRMASDLNIRSIWDVPEYGDINPFDNF
ncbi:MAG: ACP S-malonyltransferase [archaeon]|nr:ACP S-malonyltransferase [archaeon]